MEPSPGVRRPHPGSCGLLAGHPAQENGHDIQRPVWDVVRAIASNKMHYYTIFLKHMREGASDLRIQPFVWAWPDLPPASGGLEPLGTDAWLKVKAEMQLKGEGDDLEHILNKHEGEA